MVHNMLLFTPGIEENRRKCEISKMASAANGWSTLSDERLDSGSALLVKETEKGMGAVVL